MFRGKRNIFGEFEYYTGSPQAFSTTTSDIELGVEAVRQVRRRAYRTEQAKYLHLAESTKVTDVSAESSIISKQQASVGSTFLPLLFLNSCSTLFSPKPLSKGGIVPFPTWLGLFL